MKKNLLYFFCFTTWSFACNAQNESVNYNDEFVKKLELEINRNIVFSDKTFNDTVIFIFKNRSLKSANKEVKKKNFNKMKNAFKSTDYIIGNNKYKKFEPAIKTRGLKYYRIYNHTDGYLIGINEKGRISVIQQEIWDSPPGAPKIKGHY